MCPILQPYTSNAATTSSKGCLHWPSDSIERWMALRANTPTITNSAKKLKRRISATCPQSMHSISVLYESTSPMMLLFYLEYITHTNKQLNTYMMVDAEDVTRTRNGPERHSCSSKASFRFVD